ncbi:MAG: hypothetical protein AB7P07_01130 [Hyphomonadaceae bacterium]
MTQSRTSRSAGFASLFINVFLMLGVLSLAYLAWSVSAYEPPLQSAEIQLPLPEIPAPPGTLPDSEGDVVPPAP